MPMGKYKNFADCVAKNKDKQNPQAYCATIMKQVEGKNPVASMAKSMIGGK